MVIGPASHPLLPARDHLASIAWLDRAILMFGPRKAGTTLFQNLLDGSDEVLVYPAELKLKHFVRTLRHRNSAASYLERSLVPRVNSSRFSVDRYRALWSDALALDRRWPIGDLIRFDAWCVSQATDRPPVRLSMWCAKEVGGGGHRDILAFWRRVFTPGKALFVVRDPSAVTRAVLNERRRKGRELSAAEIVHETLAPLRVMRRQSRYINDPDVHFTAFEDIVADPQREMAMVAAFLGIEPTSAFARPSVFGEPVVVRTASRPTMEVFRSDASWREGLTRREQRIASAAMRTAALVPWLALDYEALRARIADTRQKQRETSGIGLAASGSPR